jgi:hypothetical protein
MFSPSRFADPTGTTASADFCQVRAVLAFDVATATLVSGTPTDLPA